MNCRRLFLVIGFIVLLGLDTSNGQDEDNPDNSINNNPDDEDDENDESGNYSFQNFFQKF